MSSIRSKTVKVKIQSERGPMALFWAPLHSKVVTDVFLLGLFKYGGIKRHIMLA
ncbi:MAG: hypothetical protein LWW85_05715 [Marinilabiliales bacterium]|nr:hypothetical protein [Marinilabiliales bacterium]